MAKYRKKPVVIEAVQLKEDCLNIGEIQDFVPEHLIDFNCYKNEYYIRTLEGDQFITPGDFVIKGVAGEFYPCKPDIFEQTYDPVD